MTANNESEFRVGVVGYCPPTKFDRQKAVDMIEEAFDQIEKNNPGKEIVIVSGLTDVGVLGIAYTSAILRGWKTVGIACKRAEEHPLFPVAEKIIVGDNWGEESPTFLDSIDMIVRVGVGQQSIAEAEETKRRGKPAIEFDLPVIT